MSAIPSDDYAPIQDKAADTASQSALIFKAFRQHKLAVAGALVVVLLYFIAVSCEFLAPFDPTDAGSRSVFHPPQSVHLLDTADDGTWAIRPYVQGLTLKRDPITLKASYVPAEDHKIYLSFFGVGTPYKLWGVIPMDRHLFVPSDPKEKFYLLGADRLGRDLLSRVLYGTRISMSIGLAGVAMSLVLGLILGGISGYYRGWVDTVIQRVVELIMSLPTIPIWLGLSAALPVDWPPMWRYFAIVLILSFLGWPELSRVVRGRLMALKSEDFVTAARLDGGSAPRIIFRHMMPSMASHIIASVTLAIPAMIIAETALSFLGLGLTPPTISWGVLLREAQNIGTIVQAPWLFLPAAAVSVAVMALNFLGDGLRDAADPYAQGGRS